VLCAVGISPFGIARGQRLRGDVTVLERSYRETRRVLEAAISAYGGRDALRAIEKFSVRYYGESVHRNQSRRPSPPYDRTPLSGLLSPILRTGAFQTKFPAPISAVLTVTRRSSLTVNTAHHFLRRVQNTVPLNHSVMP